MLLSSQYSTRCNAIDLDFVGFVFRPKWATEQAKNKEMKKNESQQKIAPFLAGP